LKNERVLARFFRLSLYEHKNKVYAFMEVETISNSSDRSSFGFCEFGLYLAHSQVFALNMLEAN